MLSQVAVCVRDFASERPDADYDAIVKRFGTPQQIITSYVNEMEALEIIESFRIRKRIMLVVSTLALSGILLWAGVVGISLLNELNSSNGYYDVYVTDDVTVP